MKLSIIFLSLFLGWQDPAFNGENRLPMRATVETDRPALSLDGEWSFRGYSSPEGRDTLFYRENLSEIGWGTMPVPGMWELNGFGDPVYVCNNFPWRWRYENNPPYPPVKDNHVGQYRKSFNWEMIDPEEDVTLRIGAVTELILKTRICGGWPEYPEASSLYAGRKSGWRISGLRLPLPESFAWVSIRLPGLVSSKCVWFLLPDGYIDGKWPSAEVSLYWSGQLSSQSFGALRSLTYIHLR